jgi:TonB family protein
MMRFALALICLALLAHGSALAQSATSPATEEAARLNTEVLKLFREGKFDEALPLAKRVVELREKEAGGDPMPLAYALGNLGAIYVQKGKGGDAERALKRSLEIIEGRRATETDFAADLYMELGFVRTWEKDYDAAGPLLQRALSVRGRLHGADDASLVSTLFGLTDLYLLRREGEQARSYLSRAVSILRRQKPRNDEGMARRLKSYYCPLMATAQGDDKDKDKELKSALWSAIWRFEQPERAAESDESQKKVVAGEVLNGRVLSKPAPEYPPIAKQQKVSGLVVVSITVDETGKVIKAEALCGHPALAKASEEAARQARFTPTLLEGQPVKVSGVITYNFVLQ